MAVYAKHARKEQFHPANSIDAVATGSASRRYPTSFSGSGSREWREGRGAGTRGKRGTVTGPGPLIGHNPSIGGRPKKTGQGRFGASVGQARLSSIPPVRHARRGEEPTFGQHCPPETHGSNPDLQCASLDGHRPADLARSHRRRDRLLRARTSSPCRRCASGGPAPGRSTRPPRSPSELGMDMHFQPTIRVFGEQFGIAILTRHPSRDRPVRPPADPFGGPGLREAQRALGRGRDRTAATLQVVNAHLSLRSRERLAQARGAARARLARPSALRGSGGPARAISTRRRIRASYRLFAARHARRAALQSGRRAAGDVPHPGAGPAARPRLRHACRGGGRGGAGPHPPGADRIGPFSAPGSTSESARRGPPMRPDAGLGAQAARRQPIAGARQSFIAGAASTKMR